MMVVTMNAIIAMAEPVETHFMWRPQLRDAAVQQKWTVDWEHFDKHQAEAAAAVSTGDFPTAVAFSQESDAVYVGTAWGGVARVPVEHFIPDFLPD